MADRFPLILNTSANQIQEIASGDSLDLTGTNIANAGIITAGNVTIGAATTDLIVNGDARITGILTIGTSSLKLDGPNNLVNVGTALTLGHTQGLQFHTQNLHSAGFEVNQINVSGITTIGGKLDTNGVIEAIAGENKIPFLYADLASLPSASTYHGMFAHVHATGRGYYAHGGAWYELVNKDTNGNVALNKDLDVDGHTNLDNISVAGVSTFTGNTDFGAGIDVTGNATVSGNLSVGGVLTYEDVTNVDSVGVVTSRKGVHAGGYSAIGGSPHSYLYGRGSQGGGFSVYAAESAMEAVATNDGTHGASLLLRTATDGVAFNYNPTDNALELKSYTSTANDFTIHNTGSNINDLKNLIKATAGSDVSLYHNGVGVVTTTSSGATINQFVFDQNGITRQSTNSRLVFQGSHETRLYHASNAQIKLSFRGNGDVFRGAVDAQPNFIQLKTGADESAVVARDNSFTELYYNGSKKLNTENGGVFITGICTATAYHGDGSNLTGVAVDKISEGDTEVECVDSGTGGEVTIKADNTDVMKVIKASESEIIGKVGINQFNNRKSPLTVARGTTNSSEVNLSLTVPSCVVGGGSGIFMKSSSDLSEEKRYGTFLQSVRSDNNNGSAHFIISMENAGATGLRENLRIDPGGQVLPGADNSQNLGSSTKRWANIYSADIHCSNKGSSNDVDGTWGDFTIQEGESDLFLINNRSGKKYKFNLTEVN